MTNKPEMKGKSAASPRDSHLSVVRILLFLARLLFAAGFLGFLFGAPCAMGLLNRLPNRVLLPLGELETVAIDTKGQIYCGAQFYNRIQVYDPTGKFLRGWFIKAGGGAFRLIIDDQNRLEVFTARGNRHYQFTEFGELVSSGTYDRASIPWPTTSAASRAHDAQGRVYDVHNPHLFPRVVRTDRDGRATTVIQSPWYLWPVTGAMPAWLTGVLGMTLTAYLERRTRRG